MANFKQRKGERVPAVMGNGRLAIVNCKCPCIFVGTELKDGAATGSATCSQSTTGESITIDPEGKICLNTGCENNTTIPAKERR